MLNPEDMDELLRLSLSRYVLGEATDDDRVTVERWLAADPSRHDTVAELRKAWQTAVRLGQERPIALDVGHALTSTKRRARALRQRQWRRVALAASIACAAVGGGWWAITARPAISAPKVYTYATAPGERREIQLGEGSRVVLAPGSRVEVTLGATQREVRLEGEAFFTVAHDTNRPFVVRGDHARVRVLGTRFGVRDFPGDTAVRVAVERGKVAVADSLVVAVGQVAALTNERWRITVGGVDDALGWIHGRVRLRATALPVAVRELNRLYGLRLGIRDSSLLDEVISADFSGAAAADVVRTLATLVEARVTEDSTGMWLHH